MKETISLFNTGKYGTMGNALEQALMNHIKRYNIPGLRFTVEETGEKGGMADLVFDFGNVRYNVEVKMTDKVPMGSTSVNKYDVKLPDAKDPEDSRQDKFTNITYNINRKDLAEMD